MRFKTRDLTTNLAPVVGDRCGRVSSCTTTQQIEEEPCRDPSQVPCEDPSQPAPPPDCDETSEPQPAVVSVCPDGVTMQCEGDRTSSVGAAAKRAIRAQMLAAAGRPGPRRGRR